MPMKSKLHLDSLDDRAKARVLGTRICKACGQTKPGLEFGPRVVGISMRGAAYMTFRAKCKSCRAADGRALWAESRAEQYYDRTPDRTEKIIRLAARGYSNREIARIIKCHHMTIAKHFGKELRAGRDMFARWRAAA